MSNHLSLPTNINIEIQFSNQDAEISAPRNSFQKLEMCNNISTSIFKVLSFVLEESVVAGDSEYSVHLLRLAQVGESVSRAIDKELENLEIITEEAKGSFS